MKWERKRKKQRYEERSYFDMSPLERESHIRKQSEKKWNNNDRAYSPNVVVFIGKSD